MAAQGRGARHPRQASPSSYVRAYLIVYGLQKERALLVHLPKPTATMLAMTRQT